MSPPRITCDVFCKVVDNFGDVGVCWRLARKLSRELGYAVRLWVDDLATFHRMYPAVSESADRQRFDGVEVCLWKTPFPDVEPAAVVLETFGCDLPGRYVEALASREPAPPWINVEHLSAETWIDGCHLLPSPVTGTGLSRVFFFPGLSAASGGLVKEADLPRRREAVRRDPSALWRKLGLDAPAEGTACVSLFCYRDAPVAALLDAIAAGDRPTRVFVPDGFAREAAGTWAGRHPFPVGSAAGRGAAHVQTLPFLAQDTYDELLAACDLNFVRGEDSFARGQLAGRPIVWQIYPQSDDAHWKKLDAFLDRYLDGLAGGPGDAIRGMHAAWNGRGAVADAWPPLANAWAEARTCAQRWLDALDRLPEAGESLDRLIRKML